MRLLLPPTVVAAKNRSDVAGDWPVVVIVGQTAAVFVSPAVFVFDKSGDVVKVSERYGAWLCCAACAVFTGSVYLTHPLFR